MQAGVRRLVLARSEFAHSRTTVIKHPILPATRERLSRPRPGRMRCRGINTAKNAPAETSATSKRVTSAPATIAATVIVPMTTYSHARVMLLFIDNPPPKVSTPCR